MSKIKIGLFGGAFDPITNGHVQTIKYIADTKIFDEIWIMPCFSHVYGKEMCSSNHRIKMCSISIKNMNNIKIFDYEVKNKITEGTFYLVKELLKNKYYRNFNFSMIIGLDNANTFSKWREYESLEKTIRFVVVPRKGFSVDKNVNWYLKLPHILLKKEINIIEEISSTTIRKLIKDKNLEEANKYLNPKVLEYIMKFKLYRK